ncbi:putative ATP-dependent RNA helicase DHX30, partial [Armadillidium nasatum]
RNKLNILTNNKTGLPEVPEDSFCERFSQIILDDFASKFCFYPNWFRTRRIHRNVYLSKDKHDGDDHLISKYRGAIEKDETLIKSMVNIFPFPRNSFKNFYHLSITNLKKDYDELGPRDNKFFKFDQHGKVHEPVFVCNLELKGPIHQEIYGYGLNKKQAEAAASLKALNILFEKRLMDKKGRPSETSHSSSTKHKLSEKALKISMPLRISLFNIILEEAEILIRKYETTVKPLIENAENKYLEANKSLDRRTPKEVRDLMTGKILEDDIVSVERNIDMVLQATKISEKKEISLPIYDVKEKILDSLLKNTVVIIEGGTGCGKSTQVPQIILNNWIENDKGSMCNVIIAQPRRIATKCIAQRVAQERFENLGNTVGYKMRLEQKMLQRRGGLMFYTCGSLREMIQLNPLLEGISHVIIDEVHERSVDTDLLLLLVKRALSNGATFKLILMSATARTDDLESYFNTECVLSVPSGTLYPVKSYFMNDLISVITCKNDSEIIHTTMESPEAKLLPPSLNYEYVTQFVMYIHKEKPEGAILVFLPGWNDIMTLKGTLEKNDELWILPLHSKLHTTSQSEVFEKPPEGKRKVILSTNIAETSLTINDVVYVIDSGLQNESRYDPSRNISTMQLVWISKANATQRKGRTGRVQPGEVYCLYDEETFNNMEEYPTPEICRLPLETVALRCKSYFKDINVQDMLKELINPPLEIAVEKALDTLQHLQLLKRNDSDFGSEILTPLGKMAATFSTSPYLSKPLIYSAFLGCIKPTLNFVCLENRFSNIFMTPQENMDLRKLKLSYNDDSDTLAASGVVGHALKCFKNFNRSEEEDTAMQLICPRRINTSFKIREAFKKQLIEHLPNFTPCHLHEDEINEDDDEKEEKYPFNTKTQITLACFVPASNLIIRRVKHRKKNPLLLEKLWNEIINFYMNQDMFTITDSEELGSDKSSIMEFTEELRELTRILIRPPLITDDDDDSSSDNNNN